MGFGHGLKTCPGVGEAFLEAVMHAAALPATALQHSTDRVGEAPVGVADHEFAPRKAALIQ